MATTTIGQAQILIGGNVSRFEADVSREVQRVLDRHPATITVRADTTQLQADLKKIQDEVESSEIQGNVVFGGDVTDGNFQTQLLALTQSMEESLRQLVGSIETLNQSMAKLARHELFQTFIGLITLAFTLRTAWTHLGGEAAQTADKFQILGGILERVALVIGFLAPGVAQALGLLLNLSRGASLLHGALTRLLGVSAATATALVGLTAAAGAYLALRAITAVTRTQVEAFSALEEQLSAVGFQFGEAGEKIVDFSQTAAKTLGLARAEAIQATVQLGALFDSIGLSEEASADFSITTVQLAADLASFRDIAGGTNEVLRRLQSTLIGEAEPARRLGIIMSDFEVTQRAMVLTGKRFRTEITQQDKILARLDITLEQTAKAQGDFARTSQSIANLQRTLAGEQQTFRENIGAAVAPLTRLDLLIRVGLLGALNKLGPALSNVGEIFDGVLTAVVGGLSPALTALGVAWSGLTDVAARSIGPFAKAAGVLGAIGGVVSEATAKITGFFRNLAGGGDDAEKATEEAREKISEYAEQLDKATESADSFIDHLAQYGAGFTKANEIIFKHESLLRDIADAQDKVNALERERDRFGFGGREIIEAREAEVRAIISNERAILGEIQATRAVERAKRDLAFETEESTKKLYGYAAGSREAQEASLGLQEAILGISSAFLSQARAAASLEDANFELGEARKAFFGFGVGSKEATKASREFERAQIAAEQANISLEESILQLADAHDSLDRKTRIAAAASRIFGESHRVSERAIREQRKAELSLQSAQLRPRSARLDVDESREDLFDAERAAIAAAHGAQAAYAEDSKEFIELRRQLRDAEFAVAGAHLGVEQAVLSLQRAQLGAAKASDQFIITTQGLLAAAAQGVEGAARDADLAQRALEDARDAVITTQLSLREAQVEIQASARAMADAILATQVALAEAPAKAEREFDAAYAALDAKQNEFVEHTARNLAVLVEHFKGAGQDGAAHLDFLEDALKDVSKELRPGSPLREGLTNLLGDLRKARNNQIEIDTEGAKNSVQTLIDKLGELGEAYRRSPLPSFAIIGEVLKRIPGFPIPRQHGGFLANRQASIVGEAGPELFIPTSAGMVISNRELMELASELTRLSKSMQTSAEDVKAQAAVMEAQFERMASVLSQSITGSLGSALTDGTGGGTITVVVPVNVDGRQAAMAIAPHIRLLDRGKR